MTFCVTSSKNSDPPSPGAISNWWRYPGPGVPLIGGDRGRLLQVIGGLTAAAIRRTQRGRVVLDAHTFAVRSGKPDSSAPPEYVTLRDGAWLAITAADTSSGLSPDTIRALTAETVDSAAGELGPGLTMGEVRLVVESVKNKITNAGSRILLLIL